MPFLAASTSGICMGARGRAPGRERHAGHAQHGLRRGEAPRPPVKVRKEAPPAPLVACSPEVGQDPKNQTLRTGQPLETPHDQALSQVADLHDHRRAVPVRGASCSIWKWRVRFRPALDGTFYRVGPDQAVSAEDGRCQPLQRGRRRDGLPLQGRPRATCGPKYVMTHRFLAERAARRGLFGEYRNPFTDDPSVKGISARSPTPTWCRMRASCWR